MSIESVGEVALAMLEPEGEDLLVLARVLRAEDGLVRARPCELEAHASSSAIDQATAAPHSSRSVSKEITRMASRGR